MTIKFDKKLIFENEEDWSDFCVKENLKKLLNLFFME